MYDDIEQWLINILSGLVPIEYVHIERTVDEMGLLFTITSTDKKTTGVLIGKSGSHVDALRVLLRSYGHLQDVKASLKIIDSTLQ